MALIGQLAQLISTALANKDNLEALLERAAELLVSDTLSNSKAIQQ